MVLRIEKYNNSTFPDGLQYGYENILCIDKVNAFLLILSPILQHYKGLYKNAGFTVLLFVAVVSFIRLLVRIKENRIDGRCMQAIIPLLLFQVYKTLDHSISVSKMIYGIFMLLVFIEIASGTINTKYIVEYATKVGSIAAICLIIQYISYYVLEKHIIMVPVSLLLPESDAWILGVKTGLYGLRGVKNGFYRPSAFFLEPSHLFLYCFPMLCINLFLPKTNNWRKRKSVLLSLGILLSTSGMGIVVTIMIWIVYLLLYNDSSTSNSRARLRNLLNGRNILIVLCFMVFAVVAYFQVPAFQTAINRIVGSVNGSNSSAIDGRTRLARNLVQGISGKSLLVGVTDIIEDINFNLSGFFATIYKYGVIGVILSYWFYIQGIFRLKSAFFWISVIIVIVSFFSAHTHGTFYMIYFVLLLIDGYHVNKTLC